MTFQITPFITGATCAETLQRLLGCDQPRLHIDISFCNLKRAEKLYKYQTIFKIEER